MPCLYTIYPDLNLAVIANAGLVTLKEIITVIDQIEAHPDWNGSMNELDDFSQVRDVEFSTEDAAQLASLVTGVLERNDPKKRNAILAPDARSRALADHLHHAMENSPSLQGVIFETLEEALKYLGIDSDQDVARIAADMDAMANQS